MTRSLWLAALGAAACGDGSVLQETVIDRPVSFPVTVQRLETVPWASLQGDGRHRYTLRYDFLTPCEPYLATASGSVARSRLRVEFATEPGAGCDSALAGTFGYEATFTTPDGSPTMEELGYSVRAVHRFPGGRPADSMDVGMVIYSPAPPLSPEAVVVRGRLEPENSTINPDLVVVYFESSPGDSTCVPGPHYQYGESMGTAVSERGAIAGVLRRWSQTPAITCVVAYGYRDRQKVRLTPRALRVDFDQPGQELTIVATLPAGRGSWDRRWRP